VAVSDPRDLRGQARRTPNKRDAERDERHSDQIVMWIRGPPGRTRITLSHHSGLNPATIVPTTIAAAPIILRMFGTNFKLLHVDGHEKGRPDAFSPVRTIFGGPHTAHSLQWTPRVVQSPQRRIGAWRLVVQG